MATWRQALEVAMTDKEVARLVALSRSRTEPASRVERAQMLLAYRENPSFFAVGQRLADAYDAAQERGEVRTRADNQHVPKENKPTVTDIGLTRKVIHEARQIRDAEKRDPGVVRRTIDATLPKAPPRS